MSEPELAAAPPDERSSCNQPPAWLARLRARFPGFSARYLELDPRSLGLARIYIGGLLLVELLRRVPEIETFFTNDGLLPNYTVLQAPGTDHLFSVFFTASHLREAVALFLLCGLVFGLLLVGWRTRAIQVAAFVAILSLHARTVMFEDGSEVSTRLLVFWTLFLPLQARFSLDALRARAGSGRAAETRPCVSLATLAILLQLAACYLFNAVHKHGETWRDGSSVHYVLHQDRIVTWLGWQLRQVLTPELSAALTWSALATEALLPILLLTPIWTRPARRLAIMLGIGLHVGFALLLNLGVFSANMIGFFLLLLGPRDWDALGRLRAVRWARVHAQQSRALQRLHAWWIAGAPAAAAAPARAGGPGWLRALWTRESLVVIAVLVLGQQLLRENQVPRALKPRRVPEFVVALIEYPRLFEGWGMFAPDAPKGDLHVYVDALTVDGRHVDPLNQLASRVAIAPLSAIPERLDQSDSFCDYALGIGGRSEYHRALQNWIYRYPERTGNPNDRVVSFMLIALEDDSPPPGQTEPSNVRVRVLLRGKQRVQEPLRETR